MLAPCCGSLNEASVRHSILERAPADSLGVASSESRFTSGMALPLSAIDDDEGAALPSALPPVIDAHVHLFADPLFKAIWRWFEAYGWPIRYKLTTPEVLQFLFSRGVQHVVALHYAHKPNIARGMNAFVAEVVKQSGGRVTGVATVFPGEDDAEGILEEGFAAGLRGVKMHCHVQCFAPDSEALLPVYRACVKHDLPLVMHAGREPSSPAYKCDPYELCSADRVAHVLEAHPKLRLCVPHLGADEFTGYERLLERFENLYLDTTMMMAGYFPVEVPQRLLDCRPERILFGTDFPNLPYAWDREIRRIAATEKREERLAAVLSGNARTLFGIA